MTIRILSSMIFCIIYLCSCSKDKETVEEVDNLYTFNFEDDADSFVATPFGDHVAGTEVSNSEDDTNHCGIVFRGKANNFVDFEGYSYSGNTSYFLGINLGSCGGIFTSSVERDLVFTEDIAAGDLQISYEYYRPGEFLDYGSYIFKVEIYHTGYAASRGSVSEPIFTTVPPINSEGWTNFEQDVSVAIRSGTYKLVITQQGQSAIDNILINKSL